MEDLSTSDDQRLLELIREGDAAALKEVFNRYWERLVAIGYYHTRNKQSAEEIVSDVLAGLWFKASTLEIRSLSAWLATAVKYSVFKAILRQKRRDELLAGAPVGTTEDDETTEKALEARFLEEFVEGVVEQLPEKTRLVFKYSRDEQLSNAEIAGRLELSTKSVEYHITRALKTLRDQLKRFNNFFSSL